jgi:L-aminopeptidase/D-esterase-like protein
MTYLEERGVGFDVGVTRVPIVPAAAIFDLRLGDPRVRPDAAMARRACQAAGAGPVAQGSAGAGCGATVGKFHGLEQAMKGGLGSSSLPGPEGVVVGGLVVVNAFGDVRDPATGRIIAGARVSPESSRFADAEALLLAGQVRPPQPFRNTTLALVATNARLDRQACLRLAELASQGLARVIRPFGTMFDGDLVMALSAGEVQADLHVLGLLAQRVLMAAVVEAVAQADGLGLLPAVRDLRPGPCPA